VPCDAVLRQDWYESGGAISLAQQLLALAFVLEQLPKLAPISLFNRYVQEM
jgi:hypothetical protein